MSVDLEIICIGNELLIGKVLNTNENWLAKYSTSLGVSVKRITTVGDEVVEIKKAVMETLQRAPKFIITTGGLGPTFDDKTLQGVAEALGRKLVVNENAFEMVKTKYQEYFKEGRMEKVELTPARVKMAKLPEGAEALSNPVGTAPGVFVDVGGCYLIALPGVPSEMKAIFEGSIKPMILREAGESKFFEHSIHLEGVMESSLAPLIERVMSETPDVYVKSHPKGEERKPYIEIHFSTLANDSETAKKRFRDVKKRINELVENARRSK